MQGVQVAAFAAVKAIHSGTWLMRLVFTQALRWWLLLITALLVAGNTVYVVHVLLLVLWMTKGCVAARGELLLVMQCW